MSDWDSSFRAMAWLLVGLGVLVAGLAFGAGVWAWRLIGGGH